MNPTRHIQTLIQKRLRKNLIIENIETNDEEKILVHKTDLISLLTFLKNDPDIALDLLLDISCIEHFENASSLNWKIKPNHNSLEIFYILRSSKLHYRLWISVFINEKEPTMPTLIKLYLSSIWLERELWDMFGVVFEGHPSLKRLLMYDDFAGHPLKRSYPAEKEQAIVPIYPFPLFKNDK